MFYPICSWQPSLLAMDLCSSTPQSSANILMNQAYADMQARQNLYMTPVMSFNNFVPYGMPSFGMNLFNSNYGLSPLNEYSNWSFYA